MTTALVLLAILIPPPPAPATEAWTNGSTDGKWSTAGNWSGGIVPDATSIVSFDGGTSNADCSIDVTATVPSIVIMNGYSGTITLAAGQALTVTTDFTMSTGSFNASAGTMTIGDDFTLTDGVFTAPTGTLTIGGDLVHGTFATFNPNNGTVALQGGVIQDILGNNWDFYNFTLAPTLVSTVRFEPAMAAPVTVAGTLTLLSPTSAMILLRSTAVGSQWYIDSQGPRSIDYVDVKDSINASATTIVTGANSIDSGNNHLWHFGPLADGGGHHARCGSVGLDLLAPLALLWLLRRLARRT